MTTTEIYQCQCGLCQQSVEHTEKMLHHQINLLLSRLDEQQRRWYAAVEATRRGRGGIKAVSEITGMDEKTIARGQRELGTNLSARPHDRVRLAGGGRPPLEKKALRLNKP